MASSSATQLKHKSRVIVTNECIITLFVEPLNPEACLPGFFLFTWHGNNLRVWGVKPQQQQYTLVRPSAQRYPVYRELAPLGYALTKRRVYSDGGQRKEIRTLIQRSSLVKTCFLQMSFNQRSAFKSNNISLADDKT